MLLSVRHPFAWSAVSSTIVAILGAGRSERYGAEKLSTDLHGQPLGLWSMQTALKLGLPVCFVAGTSVPEFAAEIKDRILLLRNPEPARGLGSSLAVAAVHARTAGAKRLLVCLADMPFIRLATLRALVDFAASDGIAACSYPEAQVGPPACFGASYFSALEKLEGDSGARRLLQSSPQTIRVPVQAQELLDVDTPACLAALNRLSPRS